MSNLVLRSDMAEFFARNVRIETNVDNSRITLNELFGEGYVDVNGHSYITGYLEIRNYDYDYDDSDLMRQWQGMFTQRTGQKFDIGEYKGCLPLECVHEPDYLSAGTRFKMKFSIDHIDQYSEQRRHEIAGSRMADILKTRRRTRKKEHFDKDLFEL